MDKTKLMQLRDALSINRVMAKDADGNYTREVTPKVITDAIALCEAELARVVEPFGYLCDWGDANGLPRQVFYYGGPGNGIEDDWNCHPTVHNNLPLYSTPQEAVSQPGQAGVLRGIDAGPLSEWVDLVKRGYVSKDECLIAVNDIPKWVAQNGAQLTAINAKGTP